MCYSFGVAHCDLAINKSDLSISRSDIVDRYSAERQPLKEHAALLMTAASYL
jgi:hypothetical protein